MYETRTQPASPRVGYPSGTGPPKAWPPDHLKPFESLTPPQRLAVQEAARPIQARRRQRLYGPGDPSDRVFFLKSGIVKLAVASAEGREIIVSLLHAGELFGELALVDDGPRDHVAEVYEDGLLYAVDRDLVRELMRASPALACEISRVMGLRGRTLQRRVGELVSRSAAARVAQTLLTLAGDHGVRDAEGIVISLRLSQRDLASLTGLTRETVNAILRDLRRQHLIELQDRIIRVKAPGALDAVR